MVMHIMMCGRIEPPANAAVTYFLRNEFKTNMTHDIYRDHNKSIKKKSKYIRGEDHRPQDLQTVIKAG